jgi:hypothetical protein
MPSCFAEEASRVPPAITSEADISHPEYYTITPWSSSTHSSNYLQSPFNKYLLCAKPSAGHFACIVTLNILDGWEAGMITLFAGVGTAQLHLTFLWMVHPVCFPRFTSSC